MIRSLTPVRRQEVIPAVRLAIFPVRTIPPSDDPRRFVEVLLDFMQSTGRRG